MSSLDFLLSRKANAEEKIIQVVDDGPVVLRLKDVAGGSSTPTVVMSDTSSDITITDSDGNATTCDLSAGAYNTVGEVADYLNAASGWQCRVLDALRSDASDNVWPNGSVTASTSDEDETVFDVTSDTSALTSYRLRLTYDRTAGGPSSMSSTHRVILKSFTGNIDHTAAAQAAKVYSITNNGSTETVIWKSPLTADATSTEYSFVNTAGDGFTPGEGNDLVIAWDGTVVDAGANFLSAQYVRE